MEKTKQVHSPVKANSIRSKHEATRVMCFFWGMMPGFDWIASKAVYIAQLPDRELLRFRGVGRRTVRLIQELKVEHLSSDKCCFQALYDADCRLADEQRRRNDAFK
jgi:hypothetical protein